MKHKNVQIVCIQAQAIDSVKSIGSAYIEQIYIVNDIRQNISIYDKAIDNPISID